MGTIRHLHPASFPPPESSCTPQHLNTRSTHCDSKKSTSTMSSMHSARAQSKRLTSSYGIWLNLAACVILYSLMHTTAANPVFVDNPSLAQFQSGRNIRHLPCIVRKTGSSGVCMFAIDCIKQNGTHLGTCIDRFYFGSCCKLKEDPSPYAPEIGDNSIDQNTISHFVHESTTDLPTSALFKLPSDGPVNVMSNSSVRPMDSINNTNSTQIYGKPSPLPPRRPVPSHTTHKTSQFVVRTTTRPHGSSSVKPAPITTTTTTTTTTAKPSRRKTTIAAPVLTTDSPKVSPVEQRVETTTAPTKFFTFQIVETTTATAPEPTRFEETIMTTQKPFLMTRRPPKPSTTTVGSRGTTARPTSTTSTTVAPTTPRTTAVPKTPPTTKRPSGSSTPSHKPPIQTKHPSEKPTRRPVTTATIEKIDIPTRVNVSTTTATTAPPLKPPVTLISTFISQDELPAPAKNVTRPLAPRPKPKPTGEIVKVPRPTISSIATTVAAATPTATNATIVTSKGTKKPTTQTKPSAHKTTTTTTSRPSSANSPVQKPKPSATTSRPSVSTTASLNKGTGTGTTSIKPGLVTWTNADAEPTTNVTSNETWQPQPSATSSDWVPVPTIAPGVQNKTAVEITPPTSAPENSSTEKIIVSITSSISEIMNNASITMSKPEKPQGTLTVTTTKAPKPPRTTTPAPLVNSTTVSSTTAGTSTTTENILDLETSTNIEEAFTDSPTGTGSSSTTEEYSTEDYNATATGAMTTTPGPLGAFEGVDYREICGRRMFPEPRIVGGSNSAFGRWPWQISLRQWRTSTYLHKCGAALLNENWAITAAHCVDNVPPSDLLLRLGEYDLAEEEEPYGYQERRVQIVASHPQFDSRTFEYDLALLRFYEPVNFQPNIIPVCVPNSDENFIGQTAYVTGWGRLYEDGPLPSVLQEVAVPIINNTICESMYRSAGYIEHIPHIFICAGWKKGGYDSCEGDSGGPMVIQREDDKRFQLSGVISWGIGCAEANQPGVYTRISEFRDWINQILQF